MIEVYGMSTICVQSAPCLLSCLQGLLSRLHSTTLPLSSSQLHDQLASRALGRWCQAASAACRALSACWAASKACS